MLSVLAIYRHILRTVFFIIPPVGGGVVHPEEYAFVSLCDYLILGNSTDLDRLRMIAAECV